MDIAGSGAGQFGRINAGGPVSIAGSLTVTYTGGFNPTVITNFQFVSGSTVTGTFASTSLPVLNPGLKSVVLYDAGGVRLLVTKIADFDNSGTVTVSDIFSFLTAWFGNNPSADINGGGIGVSDIFAFLTLWFQG